MNSLFQFTPEQIRDAISECASVFLSTSEDENGETLYQLAAPSVPFVRIASQQLPHFDALDARVKHYNGQANRYSAEESAVITSLQLMIRGGDFDGMVKLCEGRRSNDVVMVNPRVQALLGQAYAEMGFDHKEKARVCFRQAEGLGYTDVFMMRRWFNMELQYNQPEAERICDEMIKRSADNPRALSEFWSKKGACEFQKANSVVTVSRDKALQALRSSIVCYFEALWVAASARIDTTETARWADRPLFRLVTLIGDELEHIPLLIEELTQRRHDLTNQAAQLLLSNLRKIPAKTVEAAPKRFKGLCSRSSAMISRSFKKVEDYPAFKTVKDELDYIQTVI
ncbi:hypothetical protein AMJ96_PD00634 (plasmid) [Rhizobium sp. N113]|nr:hypothetical protein AMJ96_PD00634 [Rhizobium sp. N113]